MNLIKWWMFSVYPLTIQSHCAEVEKSFLFFFRNPYRFYFIPIIVKHNYQTFLCVSKCFCDISDKQIEFLLLFNVNNKVLVLWLGFYLVLRFHVQHVGKCWQLHKNKLHFKSKNESQSNTIHHKCIRCPKTFFQHCLLINCYADQLIHHIINISYIDARSVKMSHKANWIMI